MHIDDLKAAVQPFLTEDFEEAFDRYSREEGGDADVETQLMGFLADLLDKYDLDWAAQNAIAEAIPHLEAGTLSTVPTVPREVAPEEDLDGTLASEGAYTPPETEEPAPEPARNTGERPKSRTGERPKSRTGERPKGRTGERPTSRSEATGESRRAGGGGGVSASAARRSGATAAGKTGRGYEFIGDVGEGAMGKVRLAKDLDLQRSVAYKEMSEEIARNKTLAAKFYAEAQITAQLDHPNIVPIYSLEATEAGALAYSMKLIKGRTWEDLVEECWPFYDNKKAIDEEHSLETRLNQFLKACEAMHFAHQRGVIHRDLKPENIMVGPYGEVYVMDWGIARVMDAPPTGTPTAWVELEKAQKPEGEMIIGTPQYMSPEQADGVTEGLTPASDQYALGLILYELISLKQAVTGKTPMAIITRQVEGEKDPMSHYGNEKIPPELKAIALKACSHKPEDRYPGVKELAEDIRRYMRGDAVLAKPDNGMQKVMRWMQKHRELTLMGIVVSFLFFGTVTGGTILWSQYQALQSAQREEALTQVLTSVGTQAAIIDGQFVHYQGLLGVLNASAVEMLGRMAPGDPTLFFGDDYDAKRVPQVEASKAYGMDISLDFPVNELAPNSDIAAASNDLRRLEPLSRYYRRLLLRSRSERTATVTKAQGDRALRDTGVPIVWAHVGLKDGGYSGFPGHGGIDDKFDPRKTPWYELGDDSKIPTWGAPYIDPNGMGLVLPCAKALYNDDDTAIGVSAIELTFDYIIEDLLEIEGMQSKSEAYLLNNTGQVVIRSSQKEKEYRGASGRARTIRMPDFDEAEVMAKIADRQSGYVEVDRDNGRNLVIFQRMSTLGWYYVVMGKSSDLL